MNDLPVNSGRVSRRQFFRLSAPCALALAVVGSEVSPATASSAVDAEVLPALLIDISRCVGCGNCQRSCGTANDLPACTDPHAGLDANTYTFIDECSTGAGGTRFVTRACMHCINPGCVAACPVAALHKSAFGPVVADTSKCIGCRYCQYACPFEVPKFEWDSTLGVMRKCTACIERLENGRKPACAAGCPTGAIQFGVRGELLADAHARLAANPEHYVPHVYGETEAGGTMRMYMSDVAFEELNLPSLASMPVPHYAEQVVTKTPAIAGGVALFSTAAYAFLKRREKGLSAPKSPAEETGR